MITSDQFNVRGAELLPGHLGIVITYVGPSEVRSEVAVRRALMAINGFLHGGSVVALADTTAGSGRMAHLPAGATGFATIELKSNYLNTAREGTVECIAKALHMGRTTQVWDATVMQRETGKTLALFRCTQILFYAAAESMADAVGRSIASLG
jgi:1,4-dihydroxy-2-naphthoyl-CoA hydrolase